MEAHQPLAEIWSAVRKDDTSRPTVGNSQSVTIASVDIRVASARLDLPPTTLSMTQFQIAAFHRRVSLRALRTFQTRIGVTSNMITMADADPTPQSLARNSLSNM